MNRGGALHLAHVNHGFSNGRTGAWANRGGLNNRRMGSGYIAHNGYGATGNAITGNLSVNRTNFGIGNGAYGYGNGGYGYGHRGYSYGNGGYGYGYGSGRYGYRNSNLVEVYLPGVGWVLVPIQAIRRF